MQREFYVQLLTEWSLGRSGHVEHLNVEYYKGRLGIIMATPGERQYYARNGRVILSLLETSGELVKLGDTVYQELEGALLIRRLNPESQARLRQRRIQPGIVGCDVWNIGV